MSQGKKQPAKVAQTVDEYINNLPKDVGDALEKIRRAIKAAAPEAEEVISYRIPTYKYYGPLVHFMAGKNHCSFITVSKSITEIFKEELQPYKTSGTTIHFSPEKPLSAILIKKIVKVRVKENNEND